MHGFSGDPFRQGCGLGNAATPLVGQAACLVFPNEIIMHLTLHGNSAAGQRAYQKCGFACDGDEAEARAGAEHLMIKPLSTGPGSLWRYAV